MSCYWVGHSKINPIDVDEFFKRKSFNFVPGFKQKIRTKTSYCMTDADQDYILDEIECCEKNDFERNVSVYSDEE